MENFSIKFSEKELELFDRLGFGYLADRIEPFVLYRTVAEDCFVNDLKGPEVESIRACLRAFQDANLRRLTPEWDSLIQFE